MWKVPRPQVKSAVSKVLQRQSPGDLAQMLQTWADCKDIVVEPAPKPDTVQFIPEVASKSWKTVLVPQRSLVSRWWTASFSALTRDLGAHAVSTPTLPTDRDERRVRQVEHAERLAHAVADKHGAATDMLAAVLLKYATASFVERVAG